MEPVVGEATDSMTDDTDPILASSVDGPFKRLRTIPAFGVHLLISSAISAVGIALAAIWPQEKHGEAYFVMVCLRAAFWLITFLFDHLIRKKHNELRMNGYHDFHRSTTMHNGVALNVVSAWNTMLLVVHVLIHHYLGGKLWATWFTPITCIAAFNVSETLVLFTTHGCYIATVFSFNKSAPPPDALRGGANSSGGSLGLMQPGGNTADLLEKQADLIAYLKDHNQKLNQKLHQMQQSVRSANIN